jgi:predicted nucleic acid-binding protein
MPLVISDTSPVRALAELGHLTWLQTLFERVVVPPGVVAELQTPPRGLPPLDVGAWPFLTIQAPTNRARVTELQSILDSGEAEAIALAEELRADVVLIDELAGRNVARQCGFAVLGTLGVLLRAKQERLCTEVRPLLDRLQREIHFFMSASLRQSILQLAGETEPGPV